MRLNKNYIIETLAEEKLWKVGESDSFTFGDWNLTLEKVSADDFPYMVNGNKTVTCETITRRYKSMESAFLHILNRFNENEGKTDDYNDLPDALENAHKWEIDVMKGTTIIYQNITANGNLTEQRSYICKDKADFQRVIDLADDGKVKILEIDGLTADFLN